MSQIKYETWQFMQIFIFVNVPENVREREISVVNVIKLFLEEILILLKLRNWKSLFWCMNLHRNVKIMVFLSKIIPLNCYCFLNVLPFFGVSLLGGNLDSKFPPKKFYNINCSRRMSKTFKMHSLWLKLRRDLLKAFLLN